MTSPRSKRPLLQPTFWNTCEADSRHQEAITVTSGQVPPSVHLVDAHLRDLVARFPTYGEPDVLRHHSLSHLATASLLDSRSLPREVAGEDGFDVALSHSFSLDGVEYLAYEGRSGARWAVFGTVYHLFLGMWDSSGTFDWRYPGEDVLGYSISRSKLNEMLALTYRRSRALRAFTETGARVRSPKSVLLFGHTPNIGHHVWNEQSGLEFLIASGRFAQLDAVWTGPSDYFAMREWFGRHPYHAVLRAGHFGSTSRSLRATCSCEARNSCFLTPLAGDFCRG
jgi:hypothetical protein